MKSKRKKAEVAADVFGRRRATPTLTNPLRYDFNKH
jgi:hypothetical protein